MYGTLSDEEPAVGTPTSGASRAESAGAESAGAAGLGGVSAGAVSSGVGVARSVGELRAVLAAGAGEVAVSELLAVIGEAQALINELGAVQAVAIARVAGTQTVVHEDGTFSQRYRPVRSHAEDGDTGAGGGAGSGAGGGAGAGRRVGARLDAAGLVSGPLGVSDAVAGRRVEEALALTGPLRAVLGAMGSGVLDARRGSVICQELEAASPEVGCTVAGLLMPGLLGALGADPSGHAGGALRRRVRAVVARVGVESLRERAVRARAERSLRRWVDEPGVDGWMGTFPAERSAQAWAAIDEVAQRYRRQGRCSSLGQARADGLLDLIEARTTATVQVRLTTTVPATSEDRIAEESVVDALTNHPAVPTPSGVVACAAATAATGAGDVAGAVVQGCELLSEGSLVEVSGLGAPQPTGVDARWLADTIREAIVDGRVRVSPVHPGTGALVDTVGALSRQGYVPGAQDRFSRIEHHLEHELERAQAHDLRLPPNRGGIGYKESHAREETEVRSGVPGGCGQAGQRDR